MRLGQADLLGGLAVQDGRADLEGDPLEVLLAAVDATPGLRSRLLGGGLRQGRLVLHALPAPALPAVGHAPVAGPGPSSQMGAGDLLRIRRHDLAAALSVLPGAVAPHLFGHGRGRAPDRPRYLAAALPLAQPVLDRFPVGLVDAAVSPVIAIHDGPFLQAGSALHPHAAASVLQGPFSYSAELFS